MIEISDEEGKMECRAMRLSFVGELGWEIHCANKDAPRVYRALFQAAKRSNIHLRNAGYRAIDSLSAEKGSFLSYFSYHFIF